MKSSYSLHDRTMLNLDSFLLSPVHALMLVGARGSGKLNIARNIAASLLGVDEQKLDSYPYFTLIKPKDISVSIEQIRELQKLLTLKTTGENKIIRRVMVIEQADSMGIEAQNAFLKNLEEPPTDTCIILNVTDSSRLLPTVASRCRLIEILPLSLNKALDAYSTRIYSDENVKKFHALSKGNAGLFNDLLSGEEQELIDLVAKAKLLIKESMGDRLVRVDELSKDKAHLTGLLDALKRISLAGLRSAAKNNNNGSIGKWRKSLLVIEKSETALLRSANQKLTLDYLLLHL